MSLFPIRRHGYKHILIGMKNQKNYEEGFDRLLMRSLRVVSARAKESPLDDFEAMVVFEIEAVPGLCNPIKRMHGGAVALLADMTTTMATAPIATARFWEFGGVTRTLNITMLQQIPIGAEVIVVCKLKSIGKRFSVAQCEVKDRTGGKLLAVAEHGKSALVIKILEIEPQVVYDTGIAFFKPCTFVAYIMSPSAAKGSTDDTK